MIGTSSAQSHPGTGTRGVTGKLAARRDKRRRRSALSRELALFDTAAELIDLAAVLDRYDDADTEEIRRSIDWTRAA